MFINRNDIVSHKLTPVRRGGQFCCIFFQIYFSFGLLKIIKIQWFDNVIAKIKRLYFFALQCTFVRLIYSLHCCSCVLVC